MSPIALLLTLAGIVGAAIGSFLNVCVARWPRGLSVVAPRSRCPRCGHQITWAENVPVVSWLLLRAKCSGCGLPISAQYPLVELAVAGLWMAAVWWAGPTLLALRLAVFATLLLGVLLTDLQFYDIPDGFTITGLVFALTTALSDLVLGSGAPFAPLPDAVVGACAGAGLVAIAGWLGEAWLKREAMGFGDVTLMAMVGAFVGPWRAILTVFLGAAIGLVVLLALAPFRHLIVTPSEDGPDGSAPSSDERAAPAEPGAAPSGSAEGAADAALPLDDRPDLPGTGAFGLPAIPFGVFLAPGAVVALLWGDRLIAWYLRFSGFP
ncbi:MAG: prepilin peptidase [Gemmatimonadaceae bacterium]|nr:prepilin peptidase [Gemmatimonadaceae bacterium]